jgi:hypothetical protein
MRHHAILLVILLHPFHLPAEPVTVRYQEGSVHGFLALRSLEGKILASGDLTQVIRGNRAVSHLVFHFRDGSVDDETTVFSQSGHLRLISDHHVQKGPAFPKPSDVTIEASTGQITVRYRDKDKEKVETSHMDLPPDVANGLILNVVKNISPDTKETKLSYVAAAPKPRLVKLSITPPREESFSIAGTHHKSTVYKVTVELGGIAGLIAPLLGKQPADTDVWVAGGEAPAFVKSEGPQYVGGPIWRIELTSPVWANAPGSSR